VIETGETRETDARSEAGQLSPCGATEATPVQVEGWVSRGEAMELTGLSERSLYRRIAEESWRTRRSGSVGLNGRPIPEIAVSSLPQSAQALYWSKHLVPPVESTADPLNLAEIPEPLRVEARRRLAIIEQAAPILAQPRGVRRAALDVFCRDREIGVATFYEWRAAYQRGGLGALLPKWGKTRGQFLALSTPLQAFLKDEYCSPRRPSPTTVYEHLAILCRHLGEALPSQTTVNRYLLTLPQPAVVLAREGPKAWRAKMEPKCHRDLNALAPNAYWCGDHREMDVFVRADDRDGAKIFRPWLTAWLDLGTRTCVGHVLRLTPNSDGIALALRAGILRFGVPQELYIDNGKDYRCHYLNGESKASRNVTLSHDVTDTLAPGVLSPLGVTITHANPYQAWSKPIEPWFSHTFPEWEKSLPGYCGQNGKARPEKLADEIKRGQLLTMAEFAERITERIEAYHRAEHGELGMAPLAAWREHEIVRPSPRSLDLLLMRQKSVKVYHQGIKLHGLHYWHDDLVLHIGHTVEVRFGDELGRVLVFVQGQFLCEALNDPAMRMGATRDDLAALHRRKKLARQRVTAYVEDRGVLRDPQKELSRLAADSRARKVVLLPEPEPTPAGVRGIPKMLPALDHAAAQLASASRIAQSAADAAHAVQPGVPATHRRGRRSDLAASALAAGAAGSAGTKSSESSRERDGREVSREELLKELVG
jgi:putative transposase